MDDRFPAQRHAFRGHLVDVDAGSRALERPRLVRDDGGDQPAAALREEAIALDEEMLEGAGFGLPDRPVRRV
ncbi:MAG TPA: hypothetical protein VGU26_09355, partial [Gaiellaceae bacterium]|nr:hypothetical protein [Gaiellaceae bacterium]